MKATYDGEPQFTQIEDSPVRYAANSPSPIFNVDRRYYWCEDGIWYDSDYSYGPWAVCSYVPRPIYYIPPSCPFYYATYCRIFSVSPYSICFGYYPGYRGCYVWGPTVVYGTGYRYSWWLGSSCYVRPCTWGVGVRYSSWSCNWTFGLGWGTSCAWSGLGYSRRAPVICGVGIGGGSNYRSAGTYRNNVGVDVAVSVKHNRNDNIYTKHPDKLIRPVQPIDPDLRRKMIKDPASVRGATRLPARRGRTIGTRMTYPETEHERSGPRAAQSAQGRSGRRRWGPAEDGPSRSGLQGRTGSHPAQPPKGRPGSRTAPRETTRNLASPSGPRIRIASRRTTTTPAGSRRLAGRIGSPQAASSGRSARASAESSSGRAAGPAPESAAGGAPRAAASPRGASVAAPGRAPGAAAQSAAAAGAPSRARPLERSRLRPPQVALPECFRNPVLLIGPCTDRTGFLVFPRSPKPGSPKPGQEPLPSHC